MMSGPTPVDVQISSSPAISYANQASNLAKNPTLPMNPRAVAEKQKRQAEQAAKAKAAAEQEKITKVKAVSTPPIKAKPAPVLEEQTEFEPVELNRPNITAGKPKGRATGYAIVKAVLSGDTLLLMGSVTAGSNDPEKAVTLSGINAPKFGRGKNQQDEPFAWESREFLRKLCIGQQVHFNINYVHEASGREYGTVTLNGQNLANVVAKNGWATVKGPATTGAKIPPEREEVFQLSAAAESMRLGVFSGENPTQKVRKINWNPDVKALYEKYKNVPIAAVIDQVRDGSSLRCELLGLDSNPLAHSMITLYLSGVLAPRTPLPASVREAQLAKKVEEDPSYEEASSEPEPFAIEAQQFTENRLLNRDVNVVIQGIDKFGSVFGTVQFAKGNISLKLLELGYARFVAWSAALSGEADKLRAAEQQAKKGGLRLWSNYTPPAAGSLEEQLENGPVELTGKVIQVVSGDTIVVVDGQGQERKFSLASVKAPKLGVKGGKDEPYAQDAKEQLRNKLIGHKVHILQEYIRTGPPQSNDAAPRVYASVFQNKINVNEALVSLGLAEVIRHRADEPRSQFYMDYLTAEFGAQKAQRGMHNPKEPVVTRITDLSERSRAPADKDGVRDAAADASSKARSAKAKQYLVFLQREKQINAVVEYVFSGARFKIYVPKEHIMISFALGGVKVPSTMKNAEGKVDPIGELAQQYVKSKLMQHSVRIEVDQLDKGSNYIGSLFYGKTNLAVELLELGYAQIFGFSAERSAHREALFEAEKKAKEGKIGLWENWVEPVAAEPSANGEDEYKRTEIKEGQDLVNVKVTEIEDCTDFFVQFIGDKGLEVVDAALKEVAETGEAFDVNGKVYVAAAQFTDGNWYRVRVDSETDEGTYRVFFIDFGNFDEVEADKLRSLPPNIAKLPPLAHHAVLAGVKAPSNDEYRENSALAFSALVWGEQLLGKVEFVDYNGNLHLTLNVSTSPESINEALLKQGWARLNSRPAPKLKKLVESLQSAENEAKRGHYNIWEYGDVSDEEDNSSAPGPIPENRPKRR